MAIVGKSAAPTQRTNTPPPAAPRTGAKKSLFGGGFADAKPRGTSGNYLRPKVGMKVVNGEVESEGEAASYLLEISRVAVKSAEEAYKGFESFIVEGQIIESDCPACPVGYQFSWVTTAKFASYESDVKGFCCEVTATDDPSAIDESDLEKITGEEQAFAGLQVRAIVKDVLTKQKQPFTRVMFQRADEK